MLILLTLGVAEEFFPELKNFLPEYYSEIRGEQHFDTNHQNL